MTTEPVRFALRWRRPRLTVYRAADYRRFAVILNRYPGVVIGIALKFGRRVFSLTWGAPGRQITGCPDCAKGVFHDRHVTVAQRAAEIAVLAEAMRAMKQADPSLDERGQPAQDMTRGAPDTP